MTENDDFTGSTRLGVGSVVLGRYRLDEQVAAGGMGVLWRATDTVLEGTVALKRVSFAHLPDDQARITRDRTLREARLAAKLRGHPHVVSLYDIQVDDGDVWLVLEYVPSRSLSQILMERGALSHAEVAQIGSDVADALVAAHALDIQHRDVTPGNVLIGTDGRVKLTDFGIAHSANDPRITQTGAVVGTISYLAPEVAREGESSWASDVFSLGATLYAALEGTPPFGHTENPVKMLHIVSTGIIRPPERAGPLHPVLLRLLELNPATRPDAATVRDSLRRTLERAGEATTVIPYSPVTFSGGEQTAPPGPHAPSPFSPASQPGLSSQQQQPGQPGPPAHHPQFGWPQDRPWHERSRVARSGSEWATGGRPSGGGPQRVVLAVLAVAVVAVLIVGFAVFGNSGDDSPQQAAGTGGTTSSKTTPPSSRAPSTSTDPTVPALPKGPVPPVRMPADLKSVDACDLLRTDALKQYGSVDILRGNAMYACGAAVNTSNGGTIAIGYETTRPQNDFTDDPEANERNDLGGIRVYLDALDKSENPSCGGEIFLADNSGFYANAFPLNEAGRKVDLCKMVRAMNHAAVNKLVKDGVPTSGYAGQYSLAARNACDLVRADTLRKVKNLSYRDFYGNFADWGCNWGEAQIGQGKPVVAVKFELLQPDDFKNEDEVDPITLGGSTVYQQEPDSESDPQTCTLYLPQQSQPNGEGTFQVVQVQVTAPDPGAKQCQYAKIVASTVKKSLAD